MSDVRIKDNSPEFMAQLYDEVDAALEEVGIFLESEAKKLLNRPMPHKSEPTPRPYIDTGLLRNSITHAVSGKHPAITSYRGDNSSRYNPTAGVPSGKYSGSAPNDPKEHKAVYIGTNVKYAEYIHEGTARTQPNRYLKDAVTMNEKQVREQIIKAIEALQNK